MRKREVQVHMAVTVMGDPFALNEEERKDIEISQWAFSIPPEHCGNIKRQTIVEGAIQLTEKSLDKMRKANLLRGGE